MPRLMPVSDITLDIATFKTFFPEFTSLDDTYLGNMLNLVCIQTNEYKGIKARCDQNRQYLALYYNLAHQMKLRGFLDGSATATNDCIGGIKKKVKSKNDEIEFDTSSQSKLDYDSTRYGQMLKQIIAQCTAGAGAMDCSGSCGCGDTTDYYYVVYGGGNT